MENLRATCRLGPPLFMTFSGSFSVDSSSFVSTPTWDTQVAGFAAQEVTSVAESFVAAMEAQGIDPVAAVEQVATSLGISISPDSVSTVSMSETEYNQLVHQLQAKLAVATVALAGLSSIRTTDSTRRAPAEASCIRRFARYPDGRMERAP